jgi:hypothetical protein
MATSKSDADKQVMDVAKPGKTAPDASAKPVIVGHKPMVQDPMMTAEVNAETEKAGPEEQLVAAATTSTAKKVIAPITREEEPGEVESPEAETTPEDSTAQTTEVGDTGENTDSNDSAVVDAVIDQVGAKKPEGLSEEELKRQEELDKLVADKKYFVPIGKVHRNSSRLIIGFTLLLLVVFLGLLLAIDAEIIEAGFTLPFDII